jgi:hypothetical protein
MWSPLFAALLQFETLLAEIKNLLLDIRYLTSVSIAMNQ